LIPTIIDTSPKYITTEKLDQISKAFGEGENKLCLVTDLRKMIKDILYNNGWITDTAINLFN